MEWPLRDYPCSFYIESGFSNRASDLDNIIKPLLDTFQSTYEEFNDNKVYYIELNKRIVPKGDEYLWIRVGTYTPNLFKGHQSQAPIEGKQEKGLEEV